VLAGVLAMLVAANAPTLWLRVEVAPESPCRADALATAIRVQRPDASLAVGPAPHPGDLEADFTEAGGSLTLRVRGGSGEPLTRSLPPAGDSCQEAIQTAALMIDRYLGELYAGEEESSSPGRGTTLVVALGPSLAQAPFAWAPGLMLQTSLGVNVFWFSLGGEANLAQTKPIGSQAPDAEYRIVPAAAWLGAGVAPQLGPGRVFVQATFGLSLLWAKTTGSGLFQTQQGFSADPYVGLCGGYALDLPLHLSLTLRYEERWVPAPSPFQIEPAPGTTSSSVSVRQFSGDLALLLGYAFF
jgi:hypothetical protein